jgi:hypothetical protein
MNELITWLQGHLTDSEKLHAEFLAACTASDYSDLEEEIQMREEAGFKSALEFVLRHVEKEQS